VRLAIVAAEKALYPVRLLCRCLEVSRSGFYAWLRGRPASMRARADAQLSVEIAASHAESRKTYGSLRSLRDLRDSGRKVSRKRVARLMRHQGLAGCRRRRSQRTTDSNHPFRVAPNVLMREFQVEAPNVAWATDRTYVWTQEGWRYLAVILDLFSRRVVGFSMSDRITRQLALDALREALVHRPGIVDLIHHSDRGSRRGDGWDNAVVESFFGTLKAELVHRWQFATREAATAAIADSIENFYNPRRRHSSLGYVSPMVFELQHATAALAA